jgi:hypothetical protein
MQNIRNRNQGVEEICFFFDLFNERTDFMIY